MVALLLLAGAREEEEGYILYFYDCSEDFDVSHI